MKTGYLTLALIFIAVLVTPVLAAQTIFGINLGSGQADMILGTILAIAAIYNVYKAVKEGKGGNTALVLLAMVVGAFQSGGFSSVEKALNIMIAMTVVQFWFDMKEDPGSKLAVGGTGLRMIVGFYMVKWIAIEGWNPLTAIMVAFLGFALLNTVIQIVYRKDTVEFAIRAAHIGQLDSNGKFVDKRRETLLMKLLYSDHKDGGHAGGDKAAAHDSKNQLEDLAHKIQVLAGEIKPKGRVSA